MRILHASIEPNPHAPSFKQLRLTLSLDTALDAQDAEHLLLHASRTTTPRISFSTPGDYEYRTVEPTVSLVPSPSKKESSS